MMKMVLVHWSFWAFLGILLSSGGHSRFSKPGWRQCGSRCWRRWRGAVFCKSGQFCLIIGFYAKRVASSWIECVFTTFTHDFGSLRKTCASASLGSLQCCPTTGWLEGKGRTIRVFASWWPMGRGYNWMLCWSTEQSIFGAKMTRCFCGIAFLGFYETFSMGSMPV